MARRVRENRFHLDAYGGIIVLPQSRTAIAPLNARRLLSGKGE
jgi:hypothetical protein